MITLPTQVTISESVVHAVLGEETVLLDPDSGIYYGLDAVGSRIWGLLAQGATEHEIVRALLLEYQVDCVQVRDDVEQFLRVLASKRLIRFVSR